MVVAYDMGTESFAPTYGPTPSATTALGDVGASCNDAQAFVDDPTMGRVLRIKLGRGVFIQNIGNYLSTGANTEYTIRVVAKLDYTNSYRRLLNVNHGNDQGLYINGCIMWYSDGCGSSNIQVAANTWHSFTFSTNPQRNAYAYLNGYNKTSWEPKTQWEAGASILSTDMVFFNDGGSTCMTGGENTAAYLKSIQVYRKVLTDAEVIAEDVWAPPMPLSPPPPLLPPQPPSLPPP